MRLDLVRRIFTLSDYTTVHLKDHSTGREGGLAFVKAMIAPEGGSHWPMRGRGLPKPEP